VIGFFLLVERNQRTPEGDASPIQDVEVGPGGKIYPRKKELAKLREAIALVETERQENNMWPRN
jgi:hypothetical protein